MTIAPVVTTVTVKAPPARAFKLFTERMGEWWEKGKTIGKNAHTEIVIEPKAGGRWFERDAQGNETNWGKVLSYDPPGRVLLGWQLTAKWQYDPDFLTELEITFVATPGGGTEVRLEHRNLERFGDAAADIAASIGRGWPKHIGDFGTYADQHKE